MTSTHYEHLIPWGWKPHFAAEPFCDGGEPGRVVAAARGNVLAQSHSGEIWCTISSSVWQQLEGQGTTPCTGDWVELRRHEHGDRASLEQVLPRVSVIARQAAGRATRAQALAVNVDLVFLVMGLDANYNPARMERLVAIAWNSGAQPVVVLNKADLVDDPQAYALNIEGVAPGVTVLTVSAETGDGLGELRSLLGPGMTAVMIGSSGVGKSSLLNKLAGEELRRTQEVRSSDGRGRHTTSLRELFLLPDGGCLIDSPGLREVGLWGDTSALDQAFSDVSELADECRFRDCTHQSEPGCAVKEALQRGELAPERYQSYLQLRKELEYVASRTDARLRQERERHWRSIGKQIRNYKKGRGPE